MLPFPQGALLEPGGVGPLESGGGTDLRSSRGAELKQVAESEVPAEDLLRLPAELDTAQGAFAQQSAGFEQANVDLRLVEDELLAVDELRKIDAALQATNDAATTGAPSSNVVPGQTPLGVAEVYRNLTGSTAVNLASAAIANVGGGEAHNNMQPYVAVNFCIALQGLFPSRN